MVSRKNINITYSFFKLKFKKYVHKKNMASLTPNAVKLAVQSPTFHQNKNQFWKMLCFLFTDYQGTKVYQHIDHTTFCLIMEQLHVVIENTDEYSTIASNKNLLKQLYHCL